MTEEKIQAVAASIIAAFPDRLELNAIVDADRVVFIGTAFSNDGPYPIVGTLSLDELIELDVPRASALVLMRSLLDDES